MEHLKFSKQEKFFWKGNDPFALEKELEAKMDAHHHCHDGEQENKDIKEKLKREGLLRHQSEGDASHRGERSAGQAAAEHNHRRPKFKDAWTEENEFMGEPSFEPRTKKGLSELCSSLDSLYGRHHMLNIMARNENFERLRKISGLYANELYIS